MSPNGLQVEEKRDMRYFCNSNQRIASLFFGKGKLSVHIRSTGGLQSY